MFGNMKDMMGMAGILKDLPRLKEQFETIKRELADARVDAETGGGAVRVTASGDLRIVSIVIDPALMSGLIDPANPDDQAMAQSLVTGAVNAALEKAQALAQERMAAAAGDLGLPIPPGLLP